MPLYLEQFFLLGRFHATRWQQNAFADPYGEWPPSPWRLLRTLAARWFQYSRETGDQDTAKIENLLGALAAQLPKFSLPRYSRRGPSLRQYQPTGEFAWSDPNKGSGAVKQSRKTLFPDQYFIVDPNEPVIWRWDDLELTKADREFVEQLVARITYFGRAESLSRIRIVENVQDTPANCTPVATGGDAPVLCFRRDSNLRIDVLLTSSDKRELAAAPIPPGTEWVFYKRPDRPSVEVRTNSIAMQSVSYVQFSVGGHLYPPQELWIKIAERLRGRALKLFNGSDELRELLSGKQSDGTASVGDHRHAYFILWPDEDGTLSRLIVWRKGKPFGSAEVDALMRAAEKPISWTNAPKGWAVRLLPLPYTTPLPRPMRGTSHDWVSLTPFVRPANRHSLRSNGRKRSSEEPEEICKRLIEKVWGVRPRTVVSIDDAAPWMKLHESVAMRKARVLRGDRTPRVGPGYRLRVTFDEPFTGPLIVGDSSHFGLGLFRAE